MKLILERNTRMGDKTGTFQVGQSVLMMTPPIGEDYWCLRVQIAKNQAVIGFPKFGTIGIGFQQEKKDWNTNLPFTCSDREILDHIKVNKGRGPSDKDCLEAIAMIQKAAPEFLVR